MPARKIKFNEEEYQILTGAELMRKAVYDWQKFANDDRTLIQWFPELSNVLKNKKYRVSPILDFEEIDE